MVLWMEMSFKAGMGEAGQLRTGQRLWLSPLFT
jgi:hypothetical protein